jgi:hypothetical protein
MRQIDIVFTKSRKKIPILGTLIRLWMCKPYSHVARRLIVPGFEHASYFQANEGKVNYEYAPHFLRENQIVKEYSFEVENKVYSEIARNCWTAKGENYGYMQNLGIFLVNLAAMIGLKIKTPWKKGRNCSEILYVSVFKQMYPELDYNPDTIRPDDIENIIKERILKK